MNEEEDVSDWESFSTDESLSPGYIPYAIVGCVWRNKSFIQQQCELWTGITYESFIHVYHST